MAPPPTSGQLRLALAQMNPGVGDLAANTVAILGTMQRAAEAGVQLVCYPELALTGYPPEDLLLKPGFIRDTRAALEAIITASAEYPDMTTIVGFVERAEDLYNAAAIIHAGKLFGTYHKHFLPNYGVFDENRYFQSGDEAPIYVIAGVKVGVNICEDIWYPTGPATLQGYAGAEVLANISASPFHADKRTGRERMLATRASDTGSIVAYVNLVGGQDELVFDGDSCVFDERGNLIARATSFTEDLLVTDLAIEGVFRSRLHDPRLRKARLDAAQRVNVVHVSAAPPLTPPHAPHGEGNTTGEKTGQRSGLSAGEAGLAPTQYLADLPSRSQADPQRSSPLHPQDGVGPRITPLTSKLAEIYAALVLGTHDYVVKNGFSHVVLGLSGGIDSALTAAIAVEALGPAAVTGVLMPSQYSSQGSLDDARDLAHRLGIATFEVPIQSPVDAFLAVLAPPLGDARHGVTQENLQARVRGTLLMALSNAFPGWLVLTTGNKSELSVGYATLYGDMAGGFAVLKDVWKTVVYDLARMINARGRHPVIPTNTIDKPPSAELRPDQRDTDSLPDYAILDPILRAYVEDDLGFAEIVALGFPEAEVRRILQMVDRNEYKRRQSAPGVKVTLRAFGRDRRLPLTSGYHEWRDA